MTTQEIISTSKRVEIILNEALYAMAYRHGECADTNQQAVVNMAKLLAEWREELKAMPMPLFD